MALLVALPIAAGCRVGTLSREELDQRYPLGRQTTMAPTGVRRAITAVRASAGGSPVRITVLMLSDDSASITAQDHRVPGNYDQHAYWDARGEVTRSPVTMRAGDEERMARDSFDLDSIPLELIPVVARRALVELPLEDARVSSLVVHKPSDAGLELRVDLTSARRHGTVTFDAAGGVLSAKVN